MQSLFFTVAVWAISGIVFTWPASAEAVEIPSAQTEPLPKNLTPSNEPIPGETGRSSRMIEVIDLLPTEPDAPTTDHTAPSAPPVDPNAPIDENALQPPVDYNGVTLNAINKITARAEQISGATGTVMRFNNLEVIAHACKSIVDNGVRGFAALLEVWETKAGNTPKKILQGWMFSTSPSLFSLEHPLYDIIVKECTAIDTEAETKEVPEKKDTKKPEPKKTIPKKK